MKQELTFVPKEYGKAYIADQLWLPKSEIRVEPFKKALEFVVSGRGPGSVSSIMRMWEETRHHITCPREFLDPKQYPLYKFPFIDLRPPFRQTSFEDLVVPRNEEQALAWAAFQKHDNGILNLACGKGKTKLALKKIAQRGVPTLVVVPDGGIMEQWKESIFGDPSKGLLPGLRFDGKLGIIQGPVFDWAHPVTLALVTTLWQKIEQGLVPEEMFRYFGQIIYDEVHQIGAPKFSLTARPFYGDRIGLTATVEREDGLDPIYRYHLGEPFYSDVIQDIVPKIFFQQTPTVLDVSSASVRGMINVSRLRSLLGTSLVGNTFRYWSIKAALDAGRKILVLSHSKNQVKLMHAMFPGSALIVAETEKSERMRLLRDSQICFAIAKLGATGVDDDALDTLFWLTPFRSKILLQQSMGRIQRFKAGKKEPLFVVFEDWFNTTLKAMCQAVRSILRQWKFEFVTLRPTQLPISLPTEVQQSYDRTLEQLSGTDEVEDDDEGQATL